MIWALLIGCTVVSPFSVSDYVTLTVPFAIGRLVPWRRFRWWARLRLAVGIIIAYFLLEDGCGRRDIRTGGHGVVQVVARCRV